MPCLLKFQRDVVSTVHNFALELLHDCRCGPHQFRAVVHPLDGLAHGRTALLKPLEKILPAPVIRKKIALRSIPVTCQQYNNESAAESAGKTGKVSWMKEPYGEGVASRTGPESCGSSNAAAEAWYWVIQKSAFVAYSVPLSKHRQDDKDVGIRCTKVQVQEGLP